MNVRVVYFGQLRQLVGKDQQRVECDGGVGVREVLMQLAGDASGDLRAMLLDDGGEVQASLLVLVNGEAVDKAAVQTLADGDEITLLPPIAGG